MRTVVMAVVAAATLAACSSSGGGGEKFTSATTGSTGPEATVAAGAPRATTGGGAATSEATSTTRGPDLALTSFKSPSANIGCHLQADEARCDIQQSSFSPPPKPPDCEGDWGHAMTVSRGQGAFGCVGDTVFDEGAPVLAYGQRTRQGSTVCTSEAAGITCTNEASGHGFFLSRDNYRIF